MSAQAETIKLCPTCSQLRHIRKSFKLCDLCEMKVLRVWYDRLHAHQEVQRVA